MISALLEHGTWVETFTVTVTVTVISFFQCTKKVVGNPPAGPAQLGPFNLSVL